jgi:hypothetical protein
VPRCREPALLVLVAALVVAATGNAAARPSLPAAQPIAPEVISLPILADTDFTVRQDGVTEGDPSATALAVVVQGIAPSASIALLRFDDGALPPDREVAEAILALEIRNALVPTDQPARSMWLAPVLTPWQPGTVTGPAGPVLARSAGIAVVPPREPGVVRWNATELVRNWLSGAPNHGLALFLAHDTDDFLYYWLHSSESGTPPRLEVTLRPAALPATATPAARAHLPILLADSPVVGWTPSPPGLASPPAATATSSCWPRCARESTAEPWAGGRQ